MKKRLEKNYEVKRTHENSKKKSLISKKKKNSADDDQLDFQNDLFIQTSDLNYQQRLGREMYDSDYIDEEDDLENGI